MMRRGVVLLLVAAAAGGVAVGGAGCANKTQRAKASAPATALVGTPRPPAPHAADDPAFFTLDQIQPAVTLAQSKRRATTAPVSLDALQWYAQAHAALARGDRNTAINLLERAAEKDPSSPEIFEDLARAYGASDKALKAYEQALALDPDN
ncbi:MAG TPA: tetratricopeptide repeat protein, partial [Tepidisphaeraceae bacterium]